jgi:hypothetical protein
LFPTEDHHRDLCDDPNEDTSWISIDRHIRCQGPMQHRLTALTDAATLLGVFMVGALVATMINVKFSWAPSIT